MTHMKAAIAALFLFSTSAHAQVKEEVDRFTGKSKIWLSRDPCGIDLIMPLPAPAKGCVASA